MFFEKRHQPRQDRLFVQDEERVSPGEELEPTARDLSHEPLPVCRGDDHVIFAVDSKRRGPNPEKRVVGRVLQTGLNVVVQVASVGQWGERQGSEEHPKAKLEPRVAREASPLSGLGDSAEPQGQARPEHRQACPEVVPPARKPRRRAGHVRRLERHCRDHCESANALRVAKRDLKCHRPTARDSDDGDIVEAE